MKQSWRTTLAGLSLLLPLGAGARVIDKLAAVVDGAVITESEVRARALPFYEEIDAQYPDPIENRAKKQDLLKQTLQGMIDEKLLVGVAKDLELTVETAEIDRGVDQIVKRNNMSLSDLERALKEQGSSLRKYRDEIREQLLRLKVIAQKVQPKVNVTPEEARAACEADLGANANAQGLEVHLQQMVFLLPTGAAAEVEEKQKKVAAALERIKAGEEFAKVAAEVSEDSLVDLGNFDVELLDPSLVTVIRKMAAGEISAPIQERGLLRVLRLAERKEIAGDGCAAKLELYRATLEDKETEKFLTQYLSELRKKAYIEVKL
jgi:peptidyl-prolyl cis-trans isomerase SurA